MKTATKATNEQQTDGPALVSVTSKSAPASPEAPRRRKWTRLLIWFVALHVPVVGGGYLAYRYFFAKPATPNIVRLSGRVEGDDSAVAPKVTGRILEIRVREGDAVKAGDVIAMLDDPQLHAREQQARSQAEAAQAQLASAQQQIAVLNDQLKQAETTAATQEAMVAAARRNVESARAGVNVANANLANPRIRSSQQAQIRNQIAQQEAVVASSRADAARARSQLEEAQQNLRDLAVLAPFDGTIATRTAEPGEVVQAGTAIVTLVDLSKVYLRGFIPEAQIGRVRLGQPARVFLDSDPKKPLQAVVSRIDPQATFTPENTYFRDERVKQVVGVKLLLKTGIGYAKPGMPVDGEIQVEAK